MRPNLLILLLNTISAVAMIVINYLSNTGTFIHTVGEVSKKYDSMIVPAGYAFSIWGFIYLLLIAFIGFQWRCRITKKDTEVIEQTGPWLFLANVCNAAWVFVWVHEFILLSLLLMLMLLFSLIMLVKKLKLEVWDAPEKIIVFVWWPVCIYIGWIIPATVANTAAFLVSRGWRGGMLAESAWTNGMIILSLGIYSLLIYSRNMREAAMVGVWAYIAVAVRQWEADNSIKIVCIAASALLMVYIAGHAYRNKATLPFIRKKIRKILFVLTSTV